MQLETRASRISIVDRSNALKLSQYLDAEQRRLTGPVKALWKRQAGIVNIETAKKAIDFGSVPLEWSMPWEEMIREFVGDTVIEVWLESMTDSGDTIARKVNLIQRKQFDFDPIMQTVKSWVDSNAGKLIANLTVAQVGSIHALLQHQIALGVTSPYILAQRLKPLVGLTMREAAAVGRLITTLIEENISIAVMNSKVERYAQFLHKNRAIRIARTEISNAYNFGQRESVQQARDAGWLPGEPVKSWMAGGPNPCDPCLENEAAGEIPLEAVFPSGHMEPTAHPGCACSQGFAVKR